MGHGTNVRVFPYPKRKTGSGTAMGKRSPDDSPVVLYRLRFMLALDPGFPASRLADVQRGVRCHDQGGPEAVSQSEGLDVMAQAILETAPG